MTQAGMILGTAADMSPEQAKGRTVDRRADVWAFGAVLARGMTHLSGAYTDAWATINEQVSIALIDKRCGRGV